MELAPIRDVLEVVCPEVTLSAVSRLEAGRTSQQWVADTDAGRLPVVRFRATQEYGTVAGSPVVVQEFVEGESAERRRSRDRAARGPGRPQVRRHRAEPAVGRRPDLRPHARRMDLRRVRPGRLQPDDRGLAGVHLAAHRPRTGRARHGAVVPAAGRPGRHRPRPPEPAQYRAIRYTDRLAEAEAVASGGSRGDSYDNAMAEALNSLFTAECIRNPAMRPKGGWKNVGDVEIGLVPPAEHEANHWATITPEHYPEAPVPTRAGSK